jgi:hypothetical protein
MPPARSENSHVFYALYYSKLEFAYTRYFNEFEIPPPRIEHKKREKVNE